MTSSTSSCAYEACDNRVAYNTLCSGHAEQNRNGQELRPLRSKRRNNTPSAECTFYECAAPAQAKGLCYGHYDQMRTGKELTPITRRKSPNTSHLRDAHGRKECTRCLRWFDEDRFNVASKNRDGLNNYCASCAKIRHRIHVFNMQPERYQALLDAQGGVCAICRKEDPTGRDLSVDHDHECCPDSGRSCGECVRGLLCWPCNTAIGQMKDNVANLRAAADYLEVANARR